MDYIKLGHTGLDVSPICLGCMSFGTTDADKIVWERVAEVAARHGVPMANIALAGLRHKNAVVAPVIGATKMAHLESAVDSLAVQLTAEEMAYLEEPYVPHQVVGHS